LYKTTDQVEFLISMLDFLIKSGVMRTPRMK